jgi:hypothetical protein
MLTRNLLPEYPVQNNNLPATQPISCQSCGDIGKVLPYTHGVCDRAGSRCASRCRRLGWGLPLLLTASASRSEVLTRMYTRPARPPVNASLPPSRAAPHDSGPVLVANTLTV